MKKYLRFQQIPHEWGRAAMLLLLLVAASIVALILPGERQGFASSELRYFETSAGGLQIVPASCPSIPSNPDYPHDTCSAGGGAEQPLPILAVSGGGSCDVGQPLTISMTSTNSEYTDFPGLFGQFYNGVAFDTYTSSAIDTTINYVYPNADTPLGIGRDSGADTYSARWEGYVKAPATGSITFYETSADGAILRVDNQLVISHWTEHANAEASGSISLTAGEWYPLVLQFFNNAGAGGITLSYSGPGVAKQIIPAANLSYANGDVHYVIDWGDGSAQERYPLFGNVSPSSVQNVSHTFTSAGSKTIQVRAVAENGIQSPWETLEVNCADCSHVPYCIGDNLWYRNESCTNVFVESCSFGCGGGSCSAIPESTVNINAGSSLVRSGSTVVITWSAEDVKSCTVSENNPGINDSWSCTGSQCVFQSQTSSPISAPTIYTLSCTGVDDNTYTDTVTVGVVPIFEEL